MITAKLHLNNEIKTVNTLCLSEEDKAIRLNPRHGTIKNKIIKAARALELKVAKNSKNIFPNRAI